MSFKAQIMNQEDIDRALMRLAHQILEKNHGAQDVCLLGIKTRGIALSQRIAANLSKIEQVEVPIGILDITPYRDDLDPEALRNHIDESVIPFSVVGKTIILVDDVLFTGRTTRAALDAVMDRGRPACIQLAVLVDRGHTKLPIRANFVGKNIPTSLNEVVAVQLAEHDGENRVVIYEKAK